MKKKHLIPVLGVACNGVCSLLIIHFWFADLYAAVTGSSVRTAYIVLVVLLALYSACRCWLIVRDKDPATKMIDRWFDK